jgi:cell division septation protein DedD
LCGEKPIRFLVTIGIEMVEQNRQRCSQSLSGFSFALRVGLFVLTLWLGFSFTSHAKQYYYSIQVSAYQSESNASEAVQLLKNLGHKAFFRKEEDKKKTIWYRVYIEVFSSRREAEKEALALKELGLISQYIVRPLEVEAKDQSAPKDKGDVYFLHLSSYKSKENAAADAKTLEERGYKAFVVPEEVKGEEWFRVYVGEFKDEAEARKIGNELKTKGLTDYFKPILINKKALGTEEPEPPKPVAL